MCVVRCSLFCVVCVFVACLSFVVCCLRFVDCCLLGVVDRLSLLVAGRWLFFAACW